MNDVFIAVNEDGDYETGGSEEDASERLSENYGGYRQQITKLSLTGVPQPRGVIDVSGELPQNEDGSYSLEIKQG